MGMIMDVACEAVPTKQKDMNSAASRYRDTRLSHWDAVACKMDNRAFCGAYYHRRLAHIYRFLVAPGQSVLEIGCATGDLLAELKPALGVGIDFSVLLNEESGLDETADGDEQKEPEGDIAE